MKAFVIDASVILRYSLEDISRIEKVVNDVLQQARKKKAELFAPPIFFSEVSNAVLYTQLDPNDARETLRDIFSLPFMQLKIHPQEYLEILDLALKYKTTVYDASYHWLAISREATFLTCDRKYYLKAKDLGFIELVE